MTAPRTHGKPGKPPADEVRGLAKRMAEVDSQAREALALLIDGHTTVRLALPQIRRHAHRLAYSESPKVPPRLRLDCAKFILDYGPPRGDTQPTRARWDHQVDPELDELVRWAAAEYGVSVPEFVRGAAAAHAEQVLNGHK